MPLSANSVDRKTPLMHPCRGAAVLTARARQGLLGGLVFERFTDDARKVVVLAQEELRMLGDAEIGTEHLLLGILHVEDAAFRGVLRDAGLELDEVRQRLVRPVRWKRRKASGHIPLSRHASQVLEESLRVATDLEQRQIEPAHLLIALIRTPDCQALQLFADYGGGRFLLGGSEPPGSPEPC
jgi:ATP-dependent Clp protease ATP-binding subunit ClpC